MPAALNVTKGFREIRRGVDEALEGAVDAAEGVRNTVEAAGVLTVGLARMAGRAGAQFMGEAADEIRDLDVPEPVERRLTQPLSNGVERIGEVLTRRFGEFKREGKQLLHEAGVEGEDALGLGDNGGPASSGPGNGRRQSSAPQAAATATS